MKKNLDAGQLKLLAMAAMTADHLTSVIFPGYPSDWPVVLIHLFGRMAAPVFWFFVAEGYHYTRDLKIYAGRLLGFAVISHFAYNFAFGIPFLPFQTSVFNQTSVIWALFWGLAALTVNDNPKLAGWQKTILTIGMTVLAFCADWSSIAVLAVLEIGTHRGNFRRQMCGMMAAVAIYAAVYIAFINPLYGVLQFGTALTIPLLARYNGKPGSPRLKWLFYAYYPLHLVCCGLIRLALHGNVGIMVGGV